MTRKKMLYNKLVVVTLLLAGAFNASAQNDTLYLSIEEVINRLKADNLHIKAMGHRLSKAEEERKAQKGLYYPSLDLNASYTMMSNPIELDLTPVRDAILPAYELIGGQTDMLNNLTGYMANTGTLDPETYQTFSQGITDLTNGREQAVNAINNGEWEKTIMEDQFAMVDASLMWPIFTGGKIRAANKAAEARQTEAVADNEKVVSQEITSLMQRYFGLQLALKVEKVRKEVVGGMQQHLDDAKKLEANGMISQAERLHAEVAFVEADRELKKAKNTVELMQTAVQNSLSTNQPVRPTTDLFIAPAAEDLSTFIAHAQTMNPAIKKLKAKEKLAEQALKKEQAAWYPSVFAYGKANIIDYQLSEYSPDWMVGVGMKINLFDGLQKVRKSQAAKLQQMEVATWQEKAKLDLATGVTKIFQELEQAADQYNAAQKSTEFAKEYLRIRKKAFAQGFATSTDVVDAQLNLAGIETESLKALYDFDVALARLLEISYKSQDIVEYAGK
ncbi:MAG: TolC family protein [Salinivirgaceae bacterium]|nr:TolC family protein [Salinivirgaceae bacterium]